MRTYVNRLDWVHPPSDVEVVSLWEPLHDGYLHEAKHDPVNRSVQFIVFVPHLKVRATIEVSGVVSAHVGRTMGPPSSSFEGSESWESFEAILNTPEAKFETLEANLLQDDEAIAIQLGGLLDGEHYYELSVSGNRIEVGGDVSSLEDLLQRGRDYWEAFGNRSIQKEP